MGKDFTGEEGIEALSPERRLRTGEPRLRSAESGMPGKNDFPVINIEKASPEALIDGIIEIAMHQGTKTGDQITDKIVAILIDIEDRRNDILKRIADALDLKNADSPASKRLNVGAKKWLANAMEIFGDESMTQGSEAEPQE